MASDLEVLILILCTSHLLQTTVVHSGSLETELKSCSVALTPHKPKLLLQQLLGLQYHLAC